MKCRPESRKSAREIFTTAVRIEANDRERAFRLLQVTGLSLDISSGGMGLTTEHMLSKGAVVKVVVPFGKGATVPLLAEVVWSKIAGSESRAGLRFLT